MASLFDLDFNALTVTPFGFDALFQSGSGSVSSVGTGSGGAVNTHHGAGVYALGPTPSLHTKYPGLDFIALGFYWCDVEQTPGNYQWQCRAGGAYQSIDTSIDDAAAKGYLILLRCFGGIEMPIGGVGSKIIGGTELDWAAHSFTHQGTVFPGVERVSYVTSDISKTENSFVPYADDPVLRVLYTRLMTALATYLNGTTAAGNRRRDYIMYVPIMMPTEQGTEMTLSSQSGTFSPTKAVTMDNGVRYGPGTSNPTGDISTINNSCMYAHIPPGALPSGATTADKKTYIQNVWIQAWKDAGDIQIPLLPCDSGLVYGSIWGGVQEATAGQVRDYLVPKYGKTKLFGQTTDYTVDYASYNKGKSDFMLKIVAMGGKIGFQTQAANPTNSNPGMKAIDWITAMQQALDIYSVHFIETQQGNFNDATYGADNLAFASTTLSTGCAANAAAWAAQNQQGHYVQFISSTTDQAYGRKNIPAGTKKVFYRMDTNSLVNSGVSILLFSTCDNGDSVQVRVDGSNIPRIVLTGSVTDWLGSSPLQDGDIIELEHVLNGALSGYVLRINKTIIHSNLALPQGTATQITTVDFGLKSKIAATLKLLRVAGNDATFPPDVSIPTNVHAPTITVISPTGSLTAEDNTYVVSIIDADGDSINDSTVICNLDSGGDLPLTPLGGGQYSIALHLAGVAGGSQDHTVHFEAADINTAGSLTGTLDLVVTVTLPPVVPPSGGTGGGVITPGPTQAAVTWTVVHYDHNGNQVCDYEPADLSFGAYDSQPGYFNGLLHLQSPFAKRQFAEPDVHDWVLFRDDTPLLGGILTGAQVDSDSRILTLAGNTWDIYFPNLVMPYDQNNPVNKHFSNKDLFAITENIASYILNSYPNSLPITMSNGVSGINIVQQDFLAAELNTLDDIIHTLGDQTPGFDYEVTWDKKLVLYASQRGTQKDYTIHLGDPGITQWHYELNGVRGSSVYGRGTPAAATAQTVIHKEDLTASAQFRHRDTITDFSTVKGLSQLGRLTSADLKDATKQLYSFIVTIQNPSPDIFTSISWGDSIKIATDGILDYDDFSDVYFRIQSVEGYVNDRGTLKAVITMGPDTSAN